MTHEKYDDFEPDDLLPPPYAPRDSLRPGELSTSLRQLELLSDDSFMSVQASHLDIVDQFLLDVEAEVLCKLHDEERTPAETQFLAAQSEMWIFAAYELLRTWVHRAKELIKLADNSGFQNKLSSLRSVDDGYTHFGREMRIKQLENAVAKPEVISRLRIHLALLHTPFKMLEHLRVAIAKHEVSGKSNRIALFPGYGRINKWCGSLDYEIENGKYILREMSRRDVADSIRSLNLDEAPPTDQEAKFFDAWLSGKGVELPD